MMLVVIIAVFLVAVTAWFLRQALIGRGHAPDLHSALQMIDILAFKNLLSTEDDAFLKKSFSARHYRIAKKARTRAIQQYLLWIANGCSSLQLLLRSRPEILAQAQSQAQLLSAVAFRLRLASLGFWIGLWLQRMFPQVDLMPGSLITAYEKLAGNVGLYLALPPDRATALSKGV